MANININLIKAKRDRATKLKLMYAKIQFFALVIGAVYVTFLFVVVGVNTAMSAKLSDLKQQIKQKELAIASMKSREELVVLCEQKLKLVTQLLQATRSPANLMLSMFAALPQTVAVKTVEVGSSVGKGAQVGMEMPNWQEATQLIKIFTNIATLEQFNRIDIPVINRDKDGKFLVNTSWLEKKL